MAWASNYLNLSFLNITEIMRLLETILSIERAETILSNLATDLCIDRWIYPIGDQEMVLKILTDDEHVQELTDQLNLRSDERLIIYPI